jgi:hypothetical protein
MAGRAAPVASSPAPGPNVNVVAVKREYLSGAPLRNRTVDLLLTIPNQSVRQNDPQSLSSQNTDLR